MSMGVRYCSNDNQMLLEHGYRNGMRKQPFVPDTSGAEGEVRHLYVETFGTYGKVGTQDNRSKYPMYRLSWDSTDLTGLRAVLPEHQRSEEFVLDLKLLCVQTTRYGDAVFTFYEELIINNLLSQAAEGHDTSLTLEDWKNLDAQCQEFTRGSHEMSPFKRNIRYEPSRPHASAEEHKSEDPKPSGAQAATYTCEICDLCGSEDKFTTDELATLGCNHFMCKTCMVRYINGKVDGMDLTGITCPHTAVDTMTCTYTIQRHEIEAILPRKDFIKYEKLEQRQREMIAHANSRTKEVDPEFVAWKKANTKDCPGCNVPIQKNGGCMHMTCGVDGCKTEFCWACRGPYKAAKFYCLKCEDCNGTGQHKFGKCPGCSGNGRFQKRGPFPGGCGYSSNGTACVGGQPGVIPQPPPQQQPRYGGNYFSQRRNNSPRSYMSSWT